MDLDVVWRLLNLVLCLAAGHGTWHWLVRDGRWDNDPYRRRMFLIGVLGMFATGVAGAVEAIFVGVEIGIRTAMWTAFVGLVALSMWGPVRWLGPRDRPNQAKSPNR